ncbi:GvpL/GvpF family gas vesicle protein [Sinosporangium siamense]|uniref:Gas vesicle protein n=1 Tax=Sinosporangium siamense TaxID=1367973 RepID=A0A919RHF8_9ACTN|nr:GvpL/GvpF family gas vesicle protein [Sinosporangium siamense]GII92870.1 gas vesicle protein [Sinosporangium siamense]
MTNETGTYLYAVAADLGIPVPTGLTGVNGGAVRGIAQGGLIAYVSTVPMDKFGEGPLRTSLENLDWLGRTARAHHHVVDAVAETGPAAPVRLVTVYSGDEQVKDLLDRRGEEFLDVLTRVAGRREWGVKAYAEARKPVEEPAGARHGGESPGTAYLKRRQASLQGQEQDRRRAAAVAEEIHDALTAFAVAGRRHRTQDPQLSGRRETMLLNGAYLVDEERGEEFARVVDGLRGPGVELELTGPWVPYSFTMLEDPAGGEGTADERL